MIVSSSDKSNNKKEFSRYTVFYIIMTFIFTFIIGKLFYLQVYRYDYYKEKADVGSTRFMEEKAPRGNILDSEGNILATNQPNYVLKYTTPDDDVDFYSTMDEVFDIIDSNGETIKDDLIIKVDDSGQIYADYGTTNVATQEAIDLRFKKDRDINRIIEQEEYPNQEGDYTDEEIRNINSKLLEVTPEEVFYYLVNLYNLYELLIPEDATEELEKEIFDEYKTYYNSQSIEYGKKTTEKLLETYTLQELREYLVIKDLIQIQSLQGYKSVTLANNIKKETALVIYQKLTSLPGIDVVLEPVRHYPYENLASHILGYVSSINVSQQESYELRGYDASTDLIGVAGIESAFEEQLRGNDGGTTVKVNSQGRANEELFTLESYPGNNIHLTIDKDVQHAAEEALEDTIFKRIEDGQTSATRGAVVAMEVNTGRILAMASYPDYDPNVFAIPDQITDEEYEIYFSPDLESFGVEHIEKSEATKTLDQLFPLDENGYREDFYDLYPRPMFNYATQGLIPPGSTFKPLTALAGLMEGVVTTDEYITDYTGVWSKDGFEAENYKRIASGITDVSKAIQVSSNYYFYELGYRMYLNGGATVESLDTLAEYAWDFGLGVDPNSEQAKNPGTGIEIQERFGQTYNFTSWKNSIINMPMYTLVDSLRNGYYGGYSFIPLDIGTNENDSDELAEAKQELKDFITDTLLKVGTAEQVRDYSGFANNIKPYVEDVLDNSDSYKETVKAYEEEKETTVDLSKQISQIATALAQYTISDQTTQITTFGQLVISGIGQGMNNVTPLQIASYVATLANGGKRYNVTIVDKITSADGEVIQEFEPEIIGEIDIPEEYLEAIKEGMYAVNTENYGSLTYQLFGKFPIPVAGKTGTADFGTEEQYEEQGRAPYANYISFAPVEKPEIAIFSTIYDGQTSSEAAPVHKAIYEAYYSDYLLELDPNYAQTSESYQKYVLGISEEEETDEEGNVNEENTTEEESEVNDSITNND